MNATSAPAYKLRPETVLTSPQLPRRSVHCYQPINATQVTGAHAGIIKRSSVSPVFAFVVRHPSCISLYDIDRLNRVRHHRSLLNRCGHPTILIPLGNSLTGHRSAEQPASPSLLDLRIASSLAITEVAHIVVAARSRRHGKGDNVYQDL